MNIEDVVQDMRALANEISQAGITGFGNGVNDLADTLEQHLQDTRQFNPPQKVIEAWSEDVEWVIYNTRENKWEYWVDVPDYFAPRALDPRTLHHRSKFYPEDET